MGIRYYAYTFDAADTAKAMADPRSVLSPDPLADAWGFERGVQFGTATMEQALPWEEMLYLDKAWGDLQRLTGPRGPHEPPRPCYRMFEGQVRYVYGGYAYDGWVRALPPEEIPAIADDLESIDLNDVPSLLDGSTRFGSTGDNFGYVTHHLLKAREFARTVASAGRGFVYAIQ